MTHSQCFNVPPKAVLILLPNTLNFKRWESENVAATQKACHGNSRSQMYNRKDLFYTKYVCLSLAYRH